jgi:uncharacterized membrane protein
MVNALVTLVVWTLFCLGLIWLVLALLAARWPALKPLRRGYLALLKACVLGLFRLLWGQRRWRERGGRVAHPRMPDRDRDPWI